MKHTIQGKTGRAQLIVRTPSEKQTAVLQPEFRVYLLPNSANRNTSFAGAGDPAYFGPDLEKAIMHIKAWTGLSEVSLPPAFGKYAAKEEAIH